MSSPQETARSGTLRRQVWFPQIGQSRTATTQPPASDAPRLLRLTKLMALAIRYDQLLCAGHLKNRADLADLAEVSEARVTQIMSLLLLAPDIQEAILMLAESAASIDPISERDMRPIVAEVDWKKQRTLWKKLFDVRF